jgi:hypothetical protein
MLAQSFRNAPAGDIERFWVQEIPQERRDTLMGIAGLLIDHPGKGFEHEGVTLLYGGHDQRGANKFLIYRKGTRLEPMQLQTMGGQVVMQNLPKPALEVIAETYDPIPELAWKRAYLMASGFMQRS